MEERILKVIFGKDGRGSTNSKLSIPITWLRKIGATPEDREVKVIFDEERQEIVIKKAK